MQEDGIYLKLYNGKDWVWQKVLLKKTDLEYIRRRWTGVKEKSPILVKRHKKYYLQFSFEEDTEFRTRPVEERRICAVDLGININSTNKESSTGISAETESTYPEGDNAPKLMYVTNTKYTYKLEDLLWKKGDIVYEYYVTENTVVDGYLEAQYYQLVDGELVLMEKGSANGNKTNHGGKIVNKEFMGVELPSTGGSGTDMIYLFGSMLTGLAGAGLLMRKRRRNAA